MHFQPRPGPSSLLVSHNTFLLLTLQCGIGSHLTTSACPICHADGACAGSYSQTARKEAAGPHTHSPAQPRAQGHDSLSLAGEDSQQVLRKLPAGLPAVCTALACLPMTSLHAPPGAGFVSCCCCTRSTTQPPGSHVAGGTGLCAQLL